MIRLPASSSAHQFLQAAAASSPADLGDLERLPRELLLRVLAELPIQDQATFARLNGPARALVLSEAKQQAARVIHCAVKAQGRRRVAPALSLGEQHALIESHRLVENLLGCRKLNRSDLFEWEETEVQRGLEAAGDEPAHHTFGEVREASRELLYAAETESDELALRGFYLYSLPKAVNTLKSVTNLDVTNNLLDDLNFLRGMTQLTRVVADENIALHDVSAVSTLQNLEELSLRDTDVTDLRPLRELPRLRVIHLEKGNVQDLRPLSAIATLQTLTISPGINVPADLQHAVTIVTT